MLSVLTQQLVVSYRLLKNEEFFSRVPTKWFDFHRTSSSACEWHPKPYIYLSIFIEVSDKLTNTENYQLVDVFLSLQMYRHVLKTESWPEKQNVHNPKEDEGENMSASKENLKLYVKL